MILITHYSAIYLEVLEKTQPRSGQPVTWQRFEPTISRTQIRGIACRQIRFHRISDGSQQP
jgi:hypothetical protein